MVNTLIKISMGIKAEDRELATSKGFTVIESQASDGKTRYSVEKSYPISTPKDYADCAANEGKDLAEKAFLYGRSLFHRQELAPQLREEIYGPKERKPRTGHSMVSVIVAAIGQVWPTVNLDQLTIAQKSDPEVLGTILRTGKLPK